MDFGHRRDARWAHLGGFFRFVIFPGEAARINDAEQKQDQQGQNECPFGRA